MRRASQTMLILSCCPPSKMAFNHHAGASNRPFDISALFLVRRLPARRRAVGPHAKGAFCFRRKLPLIHNIQLSAAPAYGLAVSVREFHALRRWNYRAAHLWLLSRIPDRLEEVFHNFHCWRHWRNSARMRDSGRTGGGGIHASCDFHGHPSGLLTAEMGDVGRALLWAIPDVDYYCCRNHDQPASGISVPCNRQHLAGRRVLHVGCCSDL